MNEHDRNQELADHICEHFAWNGRRFDEGEFVSLLDGEVFAVGPTLEEVLTALRKADPDPARGMVFEVASSTMDMIRRGEA